MFIITSNNKTPQSLRRHSCLFFSSGSQRRRSLSLPVLTLIFPALLPCLVRDSLCTALQTKILWINWSLNASDTIETWVSGNLTALTERSQPAIRWRVGEVANRVSCGSLTLPPPRPFASVRFDPLAWSSGSDQRRISGCGIRWLLAGPDSLPLWLCRVLWCMCFCVAEVFFLFSHCTPQGA